MDSTPRWLLILFTIVVIAFLGLILAYFLLRQRDLNQMTPQTNIQAVSDIPGFSLSLHDEAKLNSYLTDFGFWEENGVVYRQTRKKVSVNKLVVHLTDKEQRYDRFISAGTDEVYQASGETYADGKLDLYIFIDTSILENGKEEDLSRRINRQALHTAYTLTHLDMQTDARIESMEETLNKIVDVFFKLERTD